MWEPCHACVLIHLCMHVHAREQLTVGAMHVCMCVINCARCHSTHRPRFDKIHCPVLLLVVRALLHAERAAAVTQQQSCVRCLSPYLAQGWNCAPLITHSRERCWDIGHLQEHEQQVHHPGGVDKAY